MAKFQMKEIISPYDTNVTARIADGTGVSNQLNDIDVGKLLKLAGDSQYGLCAVGNEIEGILDTANDIAPQDGFNLGGVRGTKSGSRATVTLDGLQATPGTGVLAVGDYVVAGTVVARGTGLSGAYPKVCKATAAASAIVHKWRVVALLGASGAVGQTATIERV